MSVYLLLKLCQKRTMPLRLKHVNMIWELYLELYSKWQAMRSNVQSGRRQAPQELVLCELEGCLVYRVFIHAC